MTKAIVKSYTVANEYRRQITYAFFIACAFLTLLYVANLYLVISNTVALQKVNTAISAVSKNVESLDSEYLALSSKITPDGLGTHGFKEGKVSAYISRTTLLGRVALGGYEL